MIERPPHWPEPKQKRFFAFGCSMTSFAWPSWADLIAMHNGADAYFNCGGPGTGNRTIMQMVHEADAICSFRPEDTVLVMLTSPWRNDTFIRGEWQPRGSVFNDAFGDHYTPDWKSKFWSNEMGIMNTWLAAKSIYDLLTTRKVKFKILTALPYKTHQASEFFDGSLTDYDVSFYENELEKYLDVKRTLWEYSNDGPYTKEDRYWFDDMNCHDVHPTVIQHAHYVRDHLPEFYNEELEAAAQLVHGMIEPASHRVNYFKPEIQKYFGVKLGSMTYVIDSNINPHPNFTDYT
jgi:hypothetical protein